MGVDEVGTLDRCPNGHWAYYRNVSEYTGEIMYTSYWKKCRSRMCLFCRRILRDESYFKIVNRYFNYHASLTEAWPMDREYLLEDYKGYWKRIQKLERKYFKGTARIKVIGFKVGTNGFLHPDIHMALRSPRGFDPYEFGEIAGECLNGEGYCDKLDFIAPGIAHQKTCKYFADHILTPISEGKPAPVPAWFKGRQYAPSSRSIPFFPDKKNSKDIEIWVPRKYRDSAFEWDW